ncbi:MAG: hypothetical protein AAB608_02165 [Patescibacteria group bacterium]
MVLFFIPQILGYAYSNGDAVQAFYPSLTFFAEQLRSGEPFLWSPGMLGGFPMAIDLIGGLHSPITQFLFRTFEVVRAYNIEIFLSLAVLFVASFRAARSYALSRQASLFVAIAYSFGSHNANWSNNITVANSMYLLPILVLAFRKGMDGRYGFSIIAILATWYALIAGQPQWVVLAYIGAGLLAVFELLRTKSDGITRRRILAPLILICLSAGLGFALAWPQISQSQTFTELSARSQGLSFSDAQISSLTPFDWAWYVMPGLQIFKLNAPEPTLYIGIMSIVLALGAYAVRASDARVRPMMFLFGFGILSALRFSPIFWLMHQLPVLELFRGSNRWMYVGNFGLAMMAGMGFDAARVCGMHSLWSKAYRVLRWVFGILIFAALIIRLVIIPLRPYILSYAYAYFDEHFLASRVGGLSAEHYHNAIASLFHNLISNADIFNPIFFVSIASIGGALYIIRWVLRYGFDRYARGAVMVLTTFSLFFIHPNMTQIIRASVVTKLPVLTRYMQSDGGRYLSILSGSATDQKLRQAFSGAYSISDSIEFQRDLMVPNIGIQYGVSGIDGFSNIMSRRIARVISALGSERATTGNSLAYAAISMSNKLSLLTSRLPILSMLNVKYLISAYELPPAPGLSLLKEESSTRFNIPIYLYENKSVLPRIYFANNIVFVSETDEEKNFKTIIESNGDFAKRTFLECATCHTLPHRPSPSDALAIQEYRDGYVRLTTSTAHDRWLVFSESNLPGWRITIDGIPTQSYMANYLFHGISVPEGEREVVLEYTGNL